MIDLKRIFFYLPPTLQQKIMTGANKLADNVASTLGPRGRNVLLQEKGKPPFITKDGGRS